MKMFELDLGNGPARRIYLRVEQNENGGDVDIIVGDSSPAVTTESRFVLAKGSADGLAEALLNPPPHR